MHSPTSLINHCIALLGDGLDQKERKDIMLPEKLQELVGDATQILWVSGLRKQQVT